MISIFISHIHINIGTNTDLAAREVLYFFWHCLSSTGNTARTRLQKIHVNILSIAGGKKPEIIQWSRCAHTRQFKNVPHVPITSHHWHVAALKLTAWLPAVLQRLVNTSEEMPHQVAMIGTVTPPPACSGGLNGTEQRWTCLRRHTATSGLLASAAFQLASAALVGPVNLCTCCS